MSADRAELLRMAVGAVGLLAGWWAFGRPRRLAPFVDLGADHQSVTVVVPARDEVLSIGHLLDDLADRPEGTRVVVVDDHSTDGTAEVVMRHDDVTTISAPALPPGWTGKCWACHLGATSIPCDTLVFVDADVRLAPGALSAVLAEHRRHGGLVSVQPWHDVVRPYERLSAMFNVVALMGAGTGGRRSTAVFGPVLVTSAEDYRSVGGHRAVRGRVAEDMELGRRYERDGLPTTVLSCDPRISYRMYPAGIRQLVDGWTKNYAIGAGSVPLVRMLAVVAWIVFLGTASIAALDSATGRGPVAPGVVMYSAAVAQVAVVFRRVGRFGLLTAVLVPIHVAVFLAVFVRSVWRTRIRRSVVWRDRTIRIDDVPADIDVED